MLLDAQTSIAQPLANAALINSSPNMGGAINTITSAASGFLATVNKNSSESSCLSDSAPDFVPDFADDDIGGNNEDVESLFDELFEEE